MKYSLIKQDRILDEFFQVDRLQIDYQSETGKSNQIQRYNISRDNAAAVLIKNTDSNKFILTRQFRYAIKNERGHCDSLEIVAGLIDCDESPEEAAKRESIEEIGYDLESLVPIQRFFPSLGICDEVIHLFYGETSNSLKVSEGGGLESENEDIFIEEFSAEELLEKLSRGELLDSKTVIALYWLKSNQNL